MALPIDSDGVEFDVTKHNLLDDPARPQYSKTGKFVKVRKDNPNSEDLIERFLASCELQSGDIQVETKKTLAEETNVVESIAAPEIDVQLIANAVNAELIIENETTVTFRKGAVAACVNPKAFKTTEDLKRKLSQFGIY